MLTMMPCAWFLPGFCLDCVSGSDKRALRSEDVRVALPAAQLVAVTLGAVAAMNLGQRRRHVRG